MYRMKDLEDSLRMKEGVRSSSPITSLGPEETDIAHDRSSTIWNDESNISRTKTIVYFLSKPYVPLSFRIRATLNSASTLSQNYTDPLSALPGTLPTTRRSTPPPALLFRRLIPLLSTLLPFHTTPRHFVLCSLLRALHQGSSRLFDVRSLVLSRLFHELGS